MKEAMPTVYDQAFSILQVLILLCLYRSPHLVCDVLDEHAEISWTCRDLSWGTA